MTAAPTLPNRVAIPRPGRRHGEEEPPGVRRKNDSLKETWAAHRLSLALLTPALVLAGLVTGWNLQGWPVRIDDDEGTYISEAWAILIEHHISHYTYWYDHPFLGWAQLAACAWVTDGFHWVSSAVMFGRDVMWVYTMAGCVALFVMCRRLGMRRVSSAAAVVLFAASPLAVYYHRMVSLDHIGTTWLIVAVACAASRRHSLRAAFWSGAALAVAILSKETIVLCVPAVVWVLLQHTDRRTRRWNLGIFGVTTVLLLLGYPLFAVLRGELLPGAGHVSLLWSLKWQFIGRAGSGFPLTSGTPSNILLSGYWLATDPWLLLAGIAAIVPALFVRRLRPLALALLIEAVVPLKGGYLPFFYVTAMLPFAAALIAGLGDALWEPVTRRDRAVRCARWAGRAVVAACVLGFAAGVAPRWWGTLSDQSGIAGDAGSVAATHWLERHVSPETVVVTDDYIWPDLKEAGRSPLWSWKVDGDPKALSGSLSGKWDKIGYIVMTRDTLNMLGQSPTLTRAVRHSVIVARFAQGVAIRQVIPGTPRKPRKP